MNNNIAPGQNAPAPRRRPLTWTLVTLVLALAALAVGYYLRGLAQPVASPTDTDTPTDQQQAQLWTCSMHPQIKLPKPGLCPICNMDLIPLETPTAQPQHPRELTVSPAAYALMDIQTSLVERKPVDAHIRMVGKVDYDETRLRYITAWVPGRLDRLYVDYTGVPVNKGDHMVLLYSPDLLTAQQELLQALKTAQSARSGQSDLARQSAQSTLAAAREKLRLLGLTPDQIAQIEQQDAPADHLTIYAPTGGIVIHKNAQQGMYVQTGTRIYTIADLSVVWVRLDAYEADLMWLRYGQPVEFTTEAYPGQSFTGTIAFLDPVVTQATRTVKIRVNAPNGDLALKPGMFVRAVVHARVAAAGRVMEPHLAGKWICPMHPDVIKDHTGLCDICTMPLVTTESLGYVGLDPNLAEMPLVVPASAVLATGPRAVVYVQLPDTDQPTFQGRQVTLGPRAGDNYLVTQGLAEGERVVTRGNFKIDAELQIQAHPSMMNPQGAPTPATHQHGQTSPTVQHSPPPTTAQPAAPLPDPLAQQLLHALDAYLTLQQTLAADDAPAAQTAAASLAQAWSSLDLQALSDDTLALWNKHATGLDTLLDQMHQADSLPAIRSPFAAVSDALADLLRPLWTGPPTLYLIHCPMAFSNRGANWLQRDNHIRNPYFGVSMLTCGSITTTIPAPAPKDHHHDH